MYVLIIPTTLVCLLFSTAIPTFTFHAIIFLLVILLINSLLPQVETAIQSLNNSTEGELQKLTLFNSVLIRKQERTVDGFVRVTGVV